LFLAGTLNDATRSVLLSGRSADGLASAGPIVCACFGVGLATIRDSLQSGKATSVEGIGAALRAGTNCGSCLPELKRIVADAAAEVARAGDAAATTLPPSARTREPSAMS
jgi:assimilatory nitrate reductase catalytic subunit